MSVTISERKKKSYAAKPRNYKTEDDNSNGKTAASTKTEDESGDKNITYVGGEDIVRPLYYNPPTDDELLSLAEATYKTAKEESLQSANDSYADKKNSLYKSINDAIEGAAEKTESVNSNYKTAADNLENQLVKRGIQRSSAAINGLSDLEAQKLSAIEKLEKEKETEVAELNKEIEELESDLGKEISAINEKYAAAVQVRLHELKNERDEKLNEVIKYNNTLDLFYPADYYTSNSGSSGSGDTTSDSSSDTSSAEADCSDADEDYDISALTADGIKDRYLERIQEVAYDYLTMDDPEEALRLFKENESAKTYLGKYYALVYKMLENNAKKVA